MNLKETILKEHSKRQTQKVVAWIGNDASRLKELMALFLKGEYRVTQRASWVISHVAGEIPQMMKPWYRKMMDKLKDEPIHDAVKRNIVKVFEGADIPEDLAGEVYDTCFSYVRSLDEPIAVKAYSITVLEKICRRYPELKPELELLLTELVRSDSAALMVRARRALKTLGKLPSHS